MDENVLYYGDNLEVLRRYVPDESVDLIYLDPPFNSQQDYNVLFAEKDGARSTAQIKAFGDTWRWDIAAESEYEQVVEAGGRVAQAMIAFRAFLGTSDVLAYLTMMAPRLIELRRVLKPSGSIYLHCDPTASAYLRLLLDAVFAPKSFLNEIVWKRTFAHGSAKRFGPIHDTILFFSKTNHYRWAGLRAAADPAYLESHFRHVDGSTGERFQAITLTGSGIRRGESGKPWRGINPTAVRRHWALPGAILAKLGIAETTVSETLDRLDAAGRIHWPRKEGGTPRLKWFAGEAHGVALPDLWSDIPPISAHAAERLGYPTQKPESLLERIIRSSSEEGAVVLDPFCGCGTAIAVAHRLNRRWIGIDITYLAVSLVKHRLLTAFEGKARFQVVGEPVSVPDAHALARQDRFQFQYWALGLVGARPVEQKKGADKGIDGRIYFHDEANAPSKQVVLSVKSGKVGVRDVRDLRGVVEREKAQIGVLITLLSPTREMTREAADAGFYKLKTKWGREHPRMQILTVEDLLAGKQIDYPYAGPGNVTLKRAPALRPKPPENGKLPL